jgi:hypothetical protein
MTPPIITECFADTEFIVKLGFNRLSTNHQKGKGNVSATLLKNYRSKPAIAVVDRDKAGGGSAYFNEFEPITLMTSHDESLVLKKHPTETHYLILICPALEQWLLKLAKEAAIRLEDYRIQNDVNGLSRVLKNSLVAKDEQAMRLMRDLISKKIPSIETLKACIVEISNKHGLLRL